MSNFKFGSTGNSSSLFGQNPSGSGGGGGSGGSGGGGGIFGNIGASQGTTGSSTPSSFGNATGGQQSGGFSMGSAFNKPDQGKSDGAGSSSAGNLFANASSTTPNKPAESTAFDTGKSTSLFGSTTPAPSSGANMFSQPSTTPAGPPPGSMFGNQANQAASKSDAPAMTTSTTPAALSAPQNPLFGAQGQQGQQGQQGGFLGSSGSTTPSSGNLFNMNQGKKEETGAQGGGTTKPPEKPSLFGSNPTQTSSQSPSLFSTPASQPSQQPQQQQQKPFSFPSATPSSTPSSASATTTADSSQKSLFPTIGGNTSSDNASTPATTGATSSPLGAMFGPPKTTSGEGATSTTPASSGGNMFANIGKSTATADATPAAPSGGNMFANLGKSTAENDSATTPATSRGGGILDSAKPSGTASGETGTANTGATPAATGTTTTTTATSDAKTATAGATAGGAAALGSSTVGPAPPSQSRLKNKTMDEIITRWATDLSKYQKEFQEQAEQVAEWDRLLVENTGKVQKLYGNTVDAERATQEVERQLSSVEGQQDELSSWLDRYEQEVDTLLSKQVGVADTLQGPDQERERTYKLAERLSERLNEVGQDLTSMVEEVNAASASLSKTSKSDEPISQIVRILNSHLSQLQQIDQGTANLRAKISATQKTGNSLSSQYGGYRDGVGRNDGGGAADDFYRAYMGRR